MKSLDKIGQISPEELNSEKRYMYDPNSLGH